jgi:hypothetical protein
MGTEYITGAQTCREVFQAAQLYEGLQRFMADRFPTQTQPEAMLRLRTADLRSVDELRRFRDAALAIAQRHDVLCCVKKERAEAFLLGEKMRFSLSEAISAEEWRQARRAHVDEVLRLMKHSKYRFFAAPESIVSRPGFIVNGDAGVYLFVFLDITGIHCGEDSSLVLKFTDPDAIEYFSAVFASVITDPQTLRDEAVAQWLLALREHI